MEPKLAMCNIYPEPGEVLDFARRNGFKGVEWSFTLDDLPGTPSQQSRWVREILRYQPLEVRFHCPFVKIDLGHDDPRRAAEADDIFRRIVRLIAKAGGGFLSLHIGLGRNSTEPLSWEATITNLRNLVHYGAEQRVRICLENLAWGWTSRPNLFEKIVRLSGTAVTFDIGHAWSCESVRSRQFSVEDFVTPHPEKVVGAHVYDKEIEGEGHLPPRNLARISSRLDLLCDIGCSWWTLELHDPVSLMQARAVVKEYLEERACKRTPTEVSGF